MNYAGHYERLIERARVRVLAGYIERHHIVPRCLGGEDAPSNIVALTPEEHYVAHQLLVKLHPTERWLVIAAIGMAKRGTGNKVYGWLRRRHACIMREKMRAHMAIQENRAKISEALRGKKLTPEQEQRKLAALRSAAARERASIKQREVAARPEVKERMRSASLGRVQSPETRAKRASSHLGRKRPPEFGAAASARLKGVVPYAAIARSAEVRRGTKASAETRAKMSATMRANPAGRSWSKTMEHREKIAASLRGRTLPPETRIKMSIAQRARFSRQEVALCR